MQSTSERIVNIPKLYKYAKIVKLKKQTSPETTHNMLKYFLTISQLVGFLPISNVRDPNPEKLKFKWISWKILYTLLIISVLTWGVYRNLFVAYQSGNFVSRLVAPVVFGSITASFVSSINIARKWKKFVTNLSRVESGILSKYGAPKNLRRNLKLLIHSTVTLSVAEHSLPHIYCIIEHGFLYWLTQIPYVCSSCSRQNGLTWSLVYSVIDILIPITWTLGELLVMALSIIFASRLKQISMAVKTYFENKQMETNIITTLDTSNFFSQVREYITVLSEILEELDKLVASSIIWAYFGNMAFIIVQLFNSLRPLDAIYERISFFYSFTVVVIRVVVLTVAASSINEESKRFSHILISIPDHFWNKELKIIINHLHFDAFVLSANNYFKVTKGLFLNIAASIIAYELALYQFNVFP